MKKKIENIKDLLIVAQSNKDKGDLPGSLNVLNEVLNLDPDNKKALNNIANILKEMKEFKKAIEYYSRAINLDPHYLVAKINLAILYHELGDFKKAEVLYKEIIILDKLNFSIYFNLSRIDFRYFDQEKIKFIEYALINEKIDNFNKASAYFILAKNQEIKKNFKEEFKFLEKGHNYFQKNFSTEVYKQNLNYWLNLLKKKFDKIKLIEKKEKINFNDINPIFIIGMPRSGSTLVESIISSGKMKIPNGGETAIINWAVFNLLKKKLLNKDQDLKDIFIDKKDLIKNIYNKYQNLNLLKKEKEFFFTDKSLENFFYIEIILQLFPNAKFIHCKRNPADNIFAIYKNFLTKMTWTHNIDDIIFYFNNYLNIMSYFTKKYSKKIFSVELEELTNNSNQITKDIFNFCELKWSSESLEFHKRKDLLSATASNIQIREKIVKYNSEKYNVYKNYVQDFEKKINLLINKWHA